LRGRAHETTDAGIIRPLLVVDGRRGGRASAPVTSPNLRQRPPGRTTLPDRRYERISTAARSLSGSPTFDATTDLIIRERYSVFSHSTVRAVQADDLRRVWD